MSSPYLLQQNDASSYGFITDQGIKYKLYFLDYSYMFSDYPGITCPVYFFNIDVIDGDPDLTNSDKRIGLTVASIFISFFSNPRNVAIYVCDSMDERHLARKRKFDGWFSRYNDGSMIKKDGVAMVAETEIYNSIILHKNNPQLNDIIQAFEELNESVSDK